jgi:2-polyprenyl-6-methoxyphenol hydroxylase-like FAD-dependent oxidoreductase
MAGILVVGGGVCGLAAATLLARDGHDVTVLERDPEPAPATIEEAWERWERGGVAQFRQPHFLQARVRHLLDAELPDVRDALEAAGAASVNPLDRVLPGVADRARQPGDDDLTALTARRPTFERVLAQAAAEEPRVTLRRGVGVASLISRPNGRTPHVTGIRTAGGEELRADLVVDASRRGSRFPRWLTEAGCPAVQEEAEDCGFIYYTRYFRSRDGSQPEGRTPTLLGPIGTFSLLTLPCDAGTWSVTAYVSSGDQPLKRLRDSERWTAVVAACPLHAHWLDGEPITDVLPMAGVLDRYRRPLVEGRPVATGFVLVGDAWACTNPSVGRGIALGLLHSALLRDVVREHVERPHELAEAWDEVTERELTPWYWATVAADRARLAEIEALRSGAEPPPPPDPAAAVRQRFPVAAARDPDLFRALQEIAAVLTPPAAVFARPGLVERVLELTEPDERPAVPGPTRAELLELLA